MVSKCANPSCAARFRYLHEGRLFTVAADSGPHRMDGADPKVERYWLCSSCTDRMTLVLQDGHVALRVFAAIPDLGKKPQRAAFPTARSVA
jgi:hypothetical protein